MATDRIIYWKKNKVPLKMHVQRALENYLGAMATIRHDADRSYASLAGKPSWPTNGQPGVLVYANAFAKQRWFEVYYDPKYVDVITRSQDEVTCNIADGFAEFCRRFWNGRTEKDETRRRARTRKPNRRKTARNR